MSSRCGGAPAPAAPQQLVPLLSELAPDLVPQPLVLVLHGQHALLQRVQQELLPQPRPLRVLPVALPPLHAARVLAPRPAQALPVLVLVLVLLPFPLVQVAVEEHVDVHLVRVIPVLHGPVEVHVGGGHVGLRAHEVAHDERVREPWNLKKLMKPVLELQPNCFKVLI